MAKLKESPVVVWISRNRVESIGIFVVVLLLVALVAFMVTRPNAKATAAGNIDQPKAAENSVRPSVPEAPAPVVPAAAEVEKPAAVVVPQQAVAEVVTTIRKVGGADTIVKDWHNKNASQVTFPFVEDLGWEGIYRIDGKPAYLVVWCADLGSSKVAGVDYEFDKGYCGATITTEPSLSLVTTFNESAKVASERHFNMWSEANVIAENMDPENTLGRLLAETLVIQSKDLGFKVGLTGELSKMKYSEAQELVKSSEPLFPDQLPQLPAGEKSVIMTVHIVGSDGQIIADLKNRDAEFVTMPIEVTAEYDGILKVDGKMELVVCMSSDSGTFKFKNVVKEIDTGFVACVITHEWNSISVATGYNEKNGRRNISGIAWVLPDDEDIDAIAKSYATAINEKENKPYVFAILSDGSLFEIK